MQSLGQETKLLKECLALNDKESNVKFGQENRYVL